MSQAKINELVQTYCSTPRTKQEIEVFIKDTNKLFQLITTYASIHSQEETIHLLEDLKSIANGPEA